MTYPLVSVVILSFNRLSDLQETIEYCCTYTYPSLELIVVDNGSTDGSVEYISSLDDRFNKIYVPENVGSAEGHSVGMRAADGEYVITIDDDAFVEDFAIYEMVSVFDKYSNLAVISFNCLNYYQEYESDELRSCSNNISNDDVENGFFLFTESSAGFRKSVLEEVGYHQSEFFYGGEDTELSMRILAYGYRIINADKLIAYHKISDASRDNRLLRYNSIRNSFWILIQYYPRKMLLRALIQYHWCLARSIVTKREFYYIQAWAEGVLLFYPMWRRRKALDDETFSHIFFPFRSIFL